MHEPNDRRDLNRDETALYAAKPEVLFLKLPSCSSQRGLVSDARERRAGFAAGAVGSLVARLIPDRWQRCFIGC